MNETQNRALHFDIMSKIENCINSTYLIDGILASFDMLIKISITLDMDAKLVACFS